MVNVHAQILTKCYQSFCDDAPLLRTWPRLVTRPGGACRLTSIAVPNEVLVLSPSSWQTIGKSTTVVNDVVDDGKYGK